MNNTKAKTFVNALKDIDSKQRLLLGSILHSNIILEDSELMSQEDYRKRLGEIISKSNDTK